MQASPADEEEAEAESNDEPSLEERLDAILAETLAADEYRESRRCLPRQEYRSVEILNQDYLLFRRSNTYWLNRLRQRCIALRRDMVLSFNPRGTSSTCEGDQVYVVSRLDLDRGFTPSGVPIASRGTCFLGPFEAITVEQAALIREVR